MNALPEVPHSTYLTEHGPWRFTHHSVVDPRAVDDFYALYTLAFEPLKKHAVARQVLTEREFHDQMADPRVDKYVAWDSSGEAVGLTTLTRTLSVVPWISPEYFADRYPEHWARNAVYYLGFTLAHPSQRHLQFIETLVGVGMEQAITEHAVIAYDMCAYNNEVLHFEDRLRAAISVAPGARLDRLDLQYYSCITWP